jgi:hypothetical protein
LAALGRRLDSVSIWDSLQIYVLDVPFVALAAWLPSHQVLRVGEGTCPPRRPGGEHSSTAAGVHKHRHHKEEIPKHVIILGTHKGRQILDRAKIGLSDLALALNASLLDLKRCQCLGRRGTQGEEIALVFIFWKQ